MKNEMISDILMGLAVVLAILGTMGVWGLYALGVSLPVLVFAGLAVVVTIGIVVGKMHDLVESEEEETKEDRL